MFVKCDKYGILNVMPHLWCMRNEPLNVIDLKM